MSVINRVLKDLDRQGAAVFVPDGVRPVATTPAQKSRRPLVLAVGVLLAAGLAVWQHWPAQSTPVKPVAGPVAVAVASVAPAVITEPLASAPNNLPAEPAAVVKTVHEPTPAAQIKQQTAEPTLIAPPPRRSLTSQMATHLPEVEAPKVIKESRPSTPADQAEEHFREASRLIEQGRGREAQAALDEALGLAPGHVGARQTLAVLLMEGGESARAEKLLKDGIRLHGQDLWYARSLAQLYLQRGHNEQALAVLKAGLDQSPDAAYWGFYAAVLNRQGKVEETAQAYRQASRLDPGHGPWWLGLAVALEKAGHASEAAEAYGQALQTHLSSELREFATGKSQELGSH